MSCGETSLDHSSMHWRAGKTLDYPGLSLGTPCCPQVCLVSGETGCGKSTQVPQFLLDDQNIGPGCKIVCTQPRRISAIGVAERIADERGEPIGKKVKREDPNLQFFRIQNFQGCAIVNLSDSWDSARIFFCLVFPQEPDSSA